MQARHSKAYSKCEQDGGFNSIPIMQHRIQRWLPCLRVQEGEADSKMISQPWTEKVILAKLLGSTPRGSIDNLVSYVLCIGTVPSGQHRDSESQGLTSEAQLLNACEV